MKKPNKIDYNKYLEIVSNEFNIAIGLYSTAWTIHGKDKHIKQIPEFIKKFKIEITKSIALTCIVIKQVLGKENKNFYKSRLIRLKKLKKIITILTKNKNIMKRKITSLYKDKIKFKEGQWVYHDYNGLGKVAGYTIDYNKTSVIEYRVAFKRKKSYYYQFVRENRLKLSEFGTLLFNKA